MLLRATSNDHRDLNWELRQILILSLTRFHLLTKNNWVETLNDLTPIMETLLKMSVVRSSSLKVKSNTSNLLIFWKLTFGASNVGLSFEQEIVENDIHHRTQHKEMTQNLVVASFVRVVRSEAVSSRQYPAVCCFIFKSCQGILQPRPGLWAGMACVLVNRQLAITLC